MRFHLPKPLHGWRAFVGEVGVIVLGVLIALAAGQTVDYFGNRFELHKAENAMRSELRDDNLPQAFIRAAVYPCYAAQLNAIENAVASSDRAKFLALSTRYDPVLRTWDDQAWQAALSSQVLVHAGSARMVYWSGAYIPIPILSQTAKKESDESSGLSTRLDGNGPLSAEQRQRLFQVISDLRHSNREMTVSSLLFMNVLSHRGLTLTPARRHALLAEAQQSYGDCASEPTTRQVDLNSELSFAPKLPN